MGKYLRALERIHLEEDSPSKSEQVHRGAFPLRSASSVSGASVPAAPPWLGTKGVFEAAALRSITERLAPLATVGDSMRLLIAGCKAGDGASTVAAALAIDLSERLSLRTLLFDGHLRRPTLDRMFAGLSQQSVAVLIDGVVQVRQTRWPRLYVASCVDRSDEIDAARFRADLERLSTRYEAVVVDIGVPRLEPRAVALARVNDPILLVVRYGQTERCHLETTTSALQAAGRSIAGVVFNAKSQVMNERLRRFIGHE